MKLLFYKNGKLICHGDALLFDSAKLLELHRLGWAWEIQVQAF